MCGIVGALGFVDERLIRAIERASLAMWHRGPDADGLWHSPLGAPGAVLAHRRLAIIDLSESGRQPMEHPSGLITTFNGEIYNYRELREELQQLGHSFRTQSDTEVLLTAWHAWGPGALDRLRGMFAFAIWEPRSGALHLARDRLGKKPILAAEVESPSGRTFLFASELRALLATGLIPRSADAEGIASAVWNGYPISPRTMVRGVRSVDAATHEKLTLRNGVASRRYWDLPRPALRPAAAEELRVELANAVRLRLVSDVPVGVFLSGGIDSSAISALAARATGGDIRTFCVGFDEAAYDESRHADAVARALGTRHTNVPISGSAFAENLAQALSSQDQPTVDGLNTYFVSRAVREAGITVALAGTGGDELFGGYASFRDLPRSLLAARGARFAPAAVRRIFASTVRHAIYGWRLEPPPQIRWGKLEDLLEARNPVDAYQTHYGLFTREFVERLMDGYPLSETRGLPAVTYDAWLRALEGSRGLHAISLLEISSFLRERLFRDSDGAAMASSLELRLPLMDHRVVELAAAVDPQLRFGRIGRKQLLRDLALDGLDPLLFERPKAGFVLPIERWAREHLAPEISKTFADDSALARIGLRGDAIRAIWEAFLGGAKGSHWSRPWALFALARWCQENDVALDRSA